MTPVPLGELRLLSLASFKSSLWWLGLLYRNPNSFRYALTLLPLRRQVALGGGLYFGSLPMQVIVCVVLRLLLVHVAQLESHGTGMGVGLGGHAASIAIGIAGGALIVVGTSLFGRTSVAFGGLLVANSVRVIAGGAAAGVKSAVRVFIIVALFVGYFSKDGSGCFHALFLGATFGFIGGLVAWFVSSMARLFTDRILVTTVEMATETLSRGLTREKTASGIARGLALGITAGVTYGAISSLAATVSGRIAVGVACSIALGLVITILEGRTFSIGTGVTYGTTTGILAGLIFETTTGVVVGTASGLALTRGFYWPLHLWFVWPRVRAHWYPRHPVAWDDLCGAPFTGLHRLLVAYAEARPEAGAREIERLIATYPSQKASALEAKTILAIRRAAAEPALSKLAEPLAALPEGDKAYLAQVPKVREWVHEISLLATRLATADRAFLRESAAQLLVAEIEGFRHRVAGLREPLSSELQAAADRWLEVAQRELGETQRVLSKGPVTQVFRAGDPVALEREAFVERLGVIGELEQQVMLATGCPGIVLYGRRRVGKSTVLKNLGAFLPPSVRLTGVSMQDPKVFSSQADFLAELGLRVRSAVPEVGEGPEPRTLPELFGLLTTVNETMEAAKRRLLLSIDEYEGLDWKIGEKVLSEDLLVTLRESIQTHRHLIWVFAGSHQIEDLPNAPWTSYLLSARLIEVPLFTLAETRLLLTEPLKRSPLWRDRDDQRPRFAPGFWGEDGIELVQAQTAGWPHLVQLVAETAVDLVNQEATTTVTPELFERALDKAIVRGHAVFYELLRRESFLPGEWDYLSNFRNQETQPPPTDETIARSLRRRLVTLEEGGEWRLHVPLMARWLKARG